MPGENKKVVQFNIPCTIEERDSKKGSTYLWVTMKMPTGFELGFMPQDEQLKTAIGMMYPMLLNQQSK